MASLPLNPGTNLLLALLATCAGANTLLAQDRPPRGGERGRMPDPIIQTIDRDRDGVLSADEIAVAAAALATLDSPVPDRRTTQAPLLREQPGR